MKHFLFLPAVLLILALQPLQAQRRDSTYTAAEQFKWEKLIAPASLVGVGAICALSPWYMEKVNIPVRDRVLSWTGGADYQFDNYLQYAPLVSYTIAGLCGAGKHGAWEHLLTAATTFALVTACAQGFKYLTDSPRPNGGTRSFPSGHTVTAFAGAEIIRLEYGTWWGLAAYSVAGLTAFMRIWNNWHWTSDVIAGAGFGILCANAAYWLLPFERKLFHLDSKMVTGRNYQFQALPYAAATPCGSAIGLSLALQW